MKNPFLSSVLSPAMRYLKIARPEPSELDKCVAMRKAISEKLVLTTTDRDQIKRLDETINMLHAISK